MDVTSISHRNMYFRSRSSLNLWKNLTGRAVRISRLILTVFYFIIVILNISTDVKNRPFLVAKHGFYELCNDYVMTIDY